MTADKAATWKRADDHATSACALAAHRRELLPETVPAVIDELAHCGYTVNHDDMAKP